MVKTTLRLFGCLRKFKVVTAGVNVVEKVTCTHRSIENEIESELESAGCILQTVLFEVVALFVYIYEPEGSLSYCARNVNMLSEQKVT